MSGSVRPLIYGKTAKPLSEFEGSAHLKNIPFATNSSGDGVVSGSGFMMISNILKKKPPPETIPSPEELVE